MHHFLVRYPYSDRLVKVDVGAHIGRGATANVYFANVGSSEYAAKIYHNSSTFNAAKIRAMIENPPGQVYKKLGGKNYPQLAWPIGVITDTRGLEHGILLPLIDQNESFSLDHYYDSVLFSKLNSKDEAALSYKLEIAHNLSEIVSDLHEHGHYFIDCKPQNIRVFKTNHVVTLLDCDGFSIRGKNKRFAAELLSTDYISPEAQRQNLAPQRLREPQDRYALAVILFQLLNRGTHPFQGIHLDKSITESTNDEKAAACLYPHGLTPNSRIAPRPFSTHQFWDMQTRLLFDQAFTTGSPTKRPSASAWASHFAGILANKELERCANFPNDLNHIRFQGMGCAACYLADLKSSTIKSSRRESQARTENGTKTTQPQASPAPANPSRQSHWLWWIIAGLIALGILHLYGKTDSVVVKTPDNVSDSGDKHKSVKKDNGGSLRTDSKSSKANENTLVLYSALYASTNKAIGFSVGNADVQAAEQKALVECNRQRFGSDDVCRKMLSGPGQCIAISHADNGAIGFAIEDTSGAAQIKAKSACSKQGGDVCRTNAGITFCHANSTSR
jgi:serine/threonine protein kinase